LKKPCLAFSRMARKRMFAVLLALHTRSNTLNHPAHHLAGGIVTGLLGDGLTRVPRYRLQLPFIETEVECIPEEPGEAMHDDGYQRGKGFTHSFG
jgi:hypothetical protein